MKVSIIIPAFNAASSLAETLESVLRQTEPAWEAVIIDDGSVDDTVAVATRWVERDPRFRLIRQSNAGVSRARNSGIKASSGEWLCFLDADDLLHPTHLQKLLERIEASPGLTGVYCGHARFLEPGKPTVERFFPAEGDLFHLLGRISLFTIHSCLIRRSAVEAAGGFNPDYITCEDWDLWQRIARTGAEFGCVREILALYRMSSGSLSSSATQMLKDGLKVIATGYSADPRVVTPKPEHAGGLNRESMAATCFYYLSWCAGCICGGGDDAAELLEMLDVGGEPFLEAGVVAEALFRAVPLGARRTPDDWPTIPETVHSMITDFLQALERKSGAAGLAARAGTCLESLIASLPGNFITGKTLSRCVEVTAPLLDLRAPEGCERVCLKVSLEGAVLGLVHLPVFAGLLPAGVIRDSIAAEFCWPILTHFFQQTLYPSLHFEREHGMVKIWRDTLLLASDLREIDGMKAVHDAADWTLFLQELWGLPEWIQAQFYDDRSEPPAAPSIAPASGGRVVVHAGEPVPALSGMGGGAAEIELQVAGVSVGVVVVALENGAATAGQVQSAMIHAGNMELCRAVVREALIGEIWSSGKSLRERLLTKRQGKTGSAEMAGLDDPTAVIPRRRAGVFGESASRRAVLPPAVLNALSIAAASAGEPALMLPAGAEPAVRILYSPASLPPDYAAPETTSPADDGAPMKPEAFEYNRAHFESLFARSKDPWLYTSGYEQVKYEQTLSLIPEGKIQDALELACAEGHFTCQLAARVQNLTAMDISTLALREAAKRCASFPDIQYAQLDLVKDKIPGSYDLIVCSEVLYYSGNEQNLFLIGERIARALKPGGLLIMAHAHLVVDDPDKAGFNWDLPFGARRIGEIVSGAGKLMPVREIRTPFYRVQSFRKPDGWLQSMISQRRDPITQILTEQPAPLPQAVAGQALWAGGKPVPAGSTTGTSRLPILMYHRVAADGVAATRRWRVTPEQLDEQLLYLAECGYYTPHPEDWFRATLQRQPLPGRAVMLTFDDGHLDFYTEARPLLKKHGFRALVFAVSGCVGLTNRWDAWLGEESPLMDWDQLLEIQQEGFIIGSHTATHPALTTLSPADTAAELTSARAELARHLGAEIRTVAYPYGDTDAVVAHLAGAVGHSFGFTCRGRRASYSDNLLLLPRIEVRGDRSFTDFVNSLDMT